MAVNTIDYFRFGLIAISGKKYTSDVIIFPNKVRSNWYRRNAHQLCLEDIAEVITEKPEVLIIGNGTSGLVKVSPGLERIIESQGIKVIVGTTANACRKYNETCHSKRVVAALHITC